MYAIFCREECEAIQDIVVWVIRRVDEHSGFMRNCHGKE